MSDEHDEGTVVSEPLLEPASTTTSLSTGINPASAAIATISTQTFIP